MQQHLLTCRGTSRTSGGSKRTPERQLDEQQDADKKKSRLELEQGSSTEAHWAQLEERMAEFLSGIYKDDTRVRIDRVQDVVSIDIPRTGGTIRLYRGEPSSELLCPATTRLDISPLHHVVGKCSYVSKQLAGGGQDTVMTAFGIETGASNFREDGDRLEISLCHSVLDSTAYDEARTIVVEAMEALLRIQPTKTSVDAPEQSKGFEVLNAVRIRRMEGQLLTCTMSQTPYACATGSLEPYGDVQLMIYEASAHEASFYLAFPAAVYKAIPEATHQTLKSMLGKVHGKLLLRA